MVEIATIAEVTNAKIKELPGIGLNEVIEYPTGVYYAIYHKHDLLGRVRYHDQRAVLTLLVPRTTARFFSAQYFFDDPKYPTNLLRMIRKNTKRSILLWVCINAGYLVAGFASIYLAYQIVQSILQRI